MGLRNIKLPNGDELRGVDFESLGGTRYRALEHPPMTDAFGLHDIVECEEDDLGLLRMSRVVERGPWQTLFFGLSEEMMASPELDQELDGLVTRGGNWDRMCGGMLFIHVPRCRYRTVGRSFVRWIRKQGWGRRRT